MGELFDSNNYNYNYLQACHFINTDFMLPPEKPILIFFFNYNKPNIVTVVERWEKDLHKQRS